jgi:hypothetical protein
MIELLLPDLPFFELQIRGIFLSFRWADRIKRWLVSFKDSNGNILVAEKKIVTGATIPLPSFYPPLPLYLLCVKMAGEKEYPERDSFQKGEFRIVVLP